MGENFRVIYVFNYGLKYRCEFVFFLFVFCFYFMGLFYILVELFVFLRISECMG